MASRPPKMPERDQIRPEEREAYDKVVERGTGQVFDGLLQSPQVCYHMTYMARAFRSSGAQGGGMTFADREWIDMVDYVDFGRNDFGYEFHLHDALVHGIRPQAIKALRLGREEDMLEDERQLVSYIRKAREGKPIDDDHYAFIVERLGGDRAVVEFTTFILFHTMMCRLDTALKLTKSRGWSDEKIMRELDAYIDGSQPIPTELKIKLS